MNILERVEQQRVALGLSDSRMAQKLRLSGGYWSQVKQGKRKVTVRVIRGIVTAFPHLEKDAWKWPNDEILEKARRLEEGTGYGVWVICGSPGIPVEISSHDQNSYEGFISGDSNYYWCECKACGRIEMQWQATASRISCHCINSVYYNESTSRLLAAYNAARQARFGR